MVATAVPTKTKRLAGLSNIYVAPMAADGTYGTPVPITGAKSVSVTLKFDNVAFYSDNKQDFTENLFQVSDGKMQVVGLTPAEIGTLTGATVAKGGVTMNANDLAPTLAVLFEREKLDKTGKYMYVVYNCVFAPADITAQDIENKLNEDVQDLTFTVSQLATGEVYRVVDSSDPTADQTEISSWYTTVANPAGAGAASIEVQPAN